MNSRIKELAAKAGFIFWEDEEWKPEGQLIDWSSDYDSALEHFAELLVQECIDRSRNEPRLHSGYSVYDGGLDDGIKKATNSMLGLLAND